MSLTHIALQALAFVFIFPLIGVPVSGGILVAILLAILYAVVLYVVKKLVIASWFLTFGISAIVTCFFFWLIPAVAVYGLAWLVPQYIAVSSPLSAVLAGFVSMFVSYLANDD